MELINKTLLPTLSCFLLVILFFFIVNMTLQPEPEMEFFQSESEDVFLPEIFINSLSDDDRTWIVSESQPNASILRNAPISQLPLRLAGIINSGGCEGSLAIVEINKVQTTWACEDIAILDGVKVVHFFVDKIIINNNGYYESLPLAER